MPRHRMGFTLIELLVVITIIVVLLALLTPALDRAIYQAELAVCAATQDGVGTGALTYAANFKRRYPDRTYILEAAGQEPEKIYTLRPPANTSQYDLRVPIEGFISLRQLQCPLSDEVDLGYEANDDDTQLFSDHNIWFGFRYDTELGVERGMFKIGDRFTYNGVRFNLLAGDHDTIAPSNGIVESSHPDADGVMRQEVLQSGAPSGMPSAPDVPGGPMLTMKQTASRWFSDQTHVRGVIDTNQARDDGSVERFDAVPWHDGEPDREDRMRRVPKWNTGPTDNPDEWWDHIPPAR